MTTEFKSQCVMIAREIQEALGELEIAASDGSEERERVEAKNIVANVLRSYKSFLESLTEPDRAEAQRILGKKLEDMAAKAKTLA